MPYLRGSLVTKRHWIDDKEFVEMLSISQSLPGLNATNMAVLVGEKLRGVLGSIAAIIAICLPGGLLMYFIGNFYRIHGDHLWITAALKGVAAAAVGLILSTVVGLSKKSLANKFDFFFMALTVIAVNRLHQSVPRHLDSRRYPCDSLPSPSERTERECGPMNQVPALVRVFAYLSLLTVGGGMAAFPAMNWSRPSTSTSG